MGRRAPPLIAAIADHLGVDGICLPFAPAVFISSPGLAWVSTTGGLVRPSWRGLEVLLAVGAGARGSRCERQPRANQILGGSGCRVCFRVPTAFPPMDPR